jgi:hypothetical protein
VVRPLEENIPENGPRLPICKAEEPEDSYGWVDVVRAVRDGREHDLERAIIARTRGHCLLYILS